VGFAVPVVVVVVVVVLVAVFVVAVGAKRKCREQVQVVLLRFEAGLGWVAGSALEVEGELERGSRLS
jgi:NADH:ubiquinone oxidoreductase subunit 3 (subunit A)